jgi:hypothetical protein
MPRNVVALIVPQRASILRTCPSTQLWVYCGTLLTALIDMLPGTRSFKHHVIGNDFSRTCSVDQ